MGLYDDRLADLSEPRRGRGGAGPFRRGIERPYPRSAPIADVARNKSTKVQSLLFDRSAGWTESKAKAWAKSHGYKHGKTDVTDQYIRIRQLDPKRFKVKRTIPFGRGIRAVVAREGQGKKVMAKTTVAARRRRHPKKSATKSRRRRRRVAAVASPRRRRRRKVAAVAAPRRRRRRVAAAVAAPRRRRRRKATAAPVRRRRRRSVRAWRGNPDGHRKAARKGWRRKKSAPVRHRRRRKARESVMEAPRRRRRRRARETVMEARRPRRHRRRHHGMMASRGGGMDAMSMVIAGASGVSAFVLADGLDRFLATYDPAGTEMPKDKFTSNGSGTLANSLNIASSPTLIRVGAGIGVTALPVLGAVFAKNPYVRSSMGGAALGSGISLFKTFWNTVVMPMLIGKDTSPAALQKSFIARLYPAEVSASINMKAKQTAISSSGSGALSGGADVGPFALSEESPYPSAQDALRAGVHGDSQYPSTEQALRAGLHGDSPYPSTAQALRPGVGDWEPAGPPVVGPGPKANPHQDPDCGCMNGPSSLFAGVGEVEEGPRFGG